MFRFLLLFLIINVFGLETYSQTDSNLYYNKLAANEIREFEDLPGAVKIIAKIFGGNIKRANQFVRYAESFKPGSTETMFLSGILSRINGDFQSAEFKLKKVVSNDDRFSLAGFPNVWVQLGITYRAKGEYDLAIDALKQGALINLKDTWPLIQLSFLFIDLNRADEATEAFYAGLNEIDNPDNIERLYTDASVIAKDSEKNDWKKAITNKEKCEFIKVFWMRRDPNPIDRVNQRLVEHYRRITFARENYGVGYKPYFDERGEIYVVLGKPVQIYTGKSLADIRDNESWFYDNIKAGLFFDFVDFTGIYKRVPLYEAIQKDAAIDNVVEMYRDRALYNPIYNRYADKIRTEADVKADRIREKLENFAFSRDGGTLQGLADQLGLASLAHNFLSANPYTQDQLFNEASAHRENFVFGTGAPHLPINMNLASFKSSGKKDSRLEFYYTVPFRNLNFIPSITQTNAFSSEISLVLKIFDLKYNEVKTFEKKYNVSAAGNELESHFFLDQLEEDLPAGKYVAALEIRNNEKDRVGIYQFVINVRDYNSTELQVSDIEIAQYVDQTLQKEKYVKPQSNLKVVPNPSAGILRTKPLTVYYEIYNLAQNNGKTSFQVSYKIKMTELNKSFLGSITGVFSAKAENSTSSVTTKEGKSANEKEYIGFDISELPPGIANLEIVVKDLNSGKENTTSINLTILDSKEEAAKATENK